MSPTRQHPRLDRFNWTGRELDYLVNLTGVDCVRLKGTGESQLNATAQKVHAKLKRIQGDGGKQ